ncbi:MAG: DUF1236 domain-containing protein [Mesorhizobium sp.]|uniref:DUF1236 domain-containing protein n=1 Tax=unclassified Mesorhizobium TaxID=325217 RepID=UPI000FD42B36|nr:MULTISPECIES: DUF1236 domain-containing protein [unclassified Mesorhizobium]RUU90506.1 DUF1236 domain-containing protein [Mesorhizobium sp. M7A.F.Ca.MR.176.00.0.0]RVD19455.1 DUF1236 domain-containing protein [Mesorhizobium sp. M7A.F.Ca.ET.027.02.1.1]RWD11695.1 MAG: DUF1236 domain-containing protein [Mesorhizobium sp.]RWP85851.1 MAG: DUF1236 domain-containing protein [Mesorhizobium sp.]TIN01388.1 MAG: DUF1236 domain-containing protein [Mesorhizobium sp.]
MKHVLITSMLAIGLGCGTAMAQTQQPESQSGADANCASGQAGCQNGSKMGEQAQDKTKLKTDEQAQGKAGTTNQQAQDKTKLKTDEQAQGKAGTTTDQQAQDKAKMQTDEQAQGKAGTTTDQQAQDKAKTQTDEQAQGKASTQDTTSTGSINNVTVEQKTEVTQIIRETKVEPVSNVDFDITVGVEVPRQKVRLHRLPARIVKIVPAYESYEYFVLADGRIVIVDPDTFKIVLILT